MSMEVKISDIRKYLLLFFDRPMEPCFMPKGVEDISFKIPQRYCKEYFEKLEATEDVVSATLSVARDLAARFIDTKDITLPDLTIPKQLPKDGVFSVFLPQHQEMALKLIEIFMGLPDLESLVAVAVYCQLVLNPFLFVYCLSVAILHRKDTKGLEIPTIAETFPSMFVNHGILRRAQELNFVVSPLLRERIVIDVTLPKPKIPEQRVRYFREDIGVNSHHWHWHLIYPGFVSGGVTVDKDRRGELFYYMHHQILARYNSERLCNELDRVKAFKNFHEVIPDGYFPKLNITNASRSWAPRFDDIALRDVDRPDAQITLSQMETWRSHIMEAIEAMTVKDKDGKSIPLDEETGIDILGNLIEATMLSPNSDYYGSFHNQGHNLISLVHDPKGYHSEFSTIMGTTETAMRDPFFYRWHAYIDEIFTAFKDKLAPYESDKLAFPEISVKSIGVKSADGQQVSNSFNTMWERSVMNLANGLDFGRKRNVYARLTYLQHEEFNYVIEVSNNSAELLMGTVRIFMAPTLDEKGAELTFEDQRMLMIELDKFSYPLQPGDNIITRKSTASSVTIPFEQILGGESEKQLFSETALKNNYCQCGWPQNMLLPRGNEKGYPMVLFVLVSNWKLDRVDQDMIGVCSDNASYCGLRDLKYPDRRAMGFPFDRRAGAATLSDFLLPNMAVQSCAIKFTDVIVDRPGIRAKTQ